MYRAHDEANLDIAGRECCLRGYGDDPPARTSKHGEWVLDVLRYYASDSSFCLLQAADGQGDEEDDVHVGHMAFARAVEAAIENDVDVLNVSAGRPRSNCTHDGCIYCSEAQRAIDDGISVVGSAGNTPDAPVHCPSNLTDATSVAGVEFECTYSMPRVPGNPTHNPPAAYWTKQWSQYDEYPDGATDSAYCTTRNCWVEDGDCDRYRVVTEWEQNPVPSGGKPDILAPVHYAEETEEGYPFVWAASSFATPVLTGCLAGVLSEVGTRPTPFGIQESVRNAARSSDDTPVGVFDAAETRERLAEHEPAP